MSPCCFIQQLAICGSSFDPRNDSTQADPSMRHRICGSSNCDDDSLQAQVMLWSFQSDVSAVSTMAQVREKQLHEKKVIRGVPRGKIGI